MSNRRTTRDLAGGIEAAWNIAHEPLERAMTQAIMAAGLLALSAAVMVLFALGLGFPYAAWANMAIVLITIPLLTTKAFMPKNITLVALLSAIISGLRNTDKSQGAVRGVPIYATIVGYVLLGYLNVAIAASFLPVKQMPWAVPLVVIAAIGATVAGILQGGGGSYLKWCLRINLLLIILSIGTALIMVAGEANSKNNSGGTQTSQWSQASVSAYAGSNSLGRMTPVMLQPGESSVEITNFQGSVLEWDLTAGRHTYEIWTRASFEGPWTRGCLPGAWQYQFRLPSSATQGVTLEVRRVRPSATRSSQITCT